MRREPQAAPAGEAARLAARQGDAAARAYNVLNVERPSLEDTTEVMWILFRALEGGMPQELQ